MKEAGCVFSFSKMKCKIVNFVNKQALFRFGNEALRLVAGMSTCITLINR